jgi:NAD-dependent deacetylase
MIKNKGAVIFSGAGMSTESGLQDFRSRTGLWANVDPTALASVDALKNNYEQFLSFYTSRLLVPESVKPNVGHKLIAQWEHEGFIKGLITQNVDRLHQEAGSVNVAELHGSLEPVRCYSCGKIASKDDFIQGTRCPCGGRLRPSVVLFGEMLPESEIQKAESWSSHCKLFVVLGSSLVVSPANFFPRKAKHAGAKLVIINKDETPLDGIADLVVHEGIGNFLCKAQEFMDKS